MLHMQNLQNVCIANHFLLENLWKNILLNCPRGRTFTTHLRAYVLSTKVKKPWKQKTRIRVYGESSFDERVIVDENPNSHKISKPNALHLIYVSLSASNFFCSPSCKHLQSCHRQWKFYPTILELHKTPPFAPSSKNKKKNYVFPKILYKVMQDLQAHHKIRILCEDFGNMFSCQK
jgi:hypothetical protein